MLLSHYLVFVVEVSGGELQLFVAEPEDNVPADQSQTGGFKPSVECCRSLQPGCLPGTVDDSPVPAPRTVHEPDQIEIETSSWLHQAVQF